MTNSKSATDSESSFLFISFHPVDSSTVNSTVQHLDEMIEKKFNSSQEREEINREQLEIIYRIKLPSLEDRDDCRNFFLELKSIFNSTSHLSPIFTQYGVPSE